MNEKQLGEKIKKKREELGFSQTELAIKLELDQGMMSRIELGKRRLDAVKELPLLAKVFGVPYSWFYEDTASVSNELTFESLIRQKFPDIQLSDNEVLKLSEATKGFLEVFINNTPAFSDKTRKKKSKG